MFACAYYEGSAVELLDIVKFVTW